MPWKVNKASLASYFGETGENPLLATECAKGKCIGALSVLADQAARCLSEKLGLFANAAEAAAPKASASRQRWSTGSHSAGVLLCRGQANPSGSPRWEGVPRTPLLTAL